MTVDIVGKEFKQGKVRMTCQCFMMWGDPPWKLSPTWDLMAGCEIILGCLHSHIMLVRLVSARTLAWHCQLEHFLEAVWPGCPHSMLTLGYSDSLLTWKPPSPKTSVTENNGEAVCHSFWQLQKSCDITSIRFYYLRVTNVPGFKGKGYKCHLSVIKSARKYVSIYWSHHRSQQGPKAGTLLRIPRQISTTFSKSKAENQRETSALWKTMSKR